MPAINPINADVKWLTPMRLEVPGYQTDPECKGMILVDDFCVQIGWLVCLVRAGFYYNGTSIPKILWGRLGLGSPFTGPHRRGACFHDAGYQDCLELKSVDGDVIDVRLTREEVDGLFIALIQADGAGWWLRKIVYRGVRLGGWASWRA